MIIYQTKQPVALETIVRPVVDSLNESITLLGRFMNSDVPFVDQLLSHGNMLSGKRLRPTLLLLVAGSFGNIDQRHIKLAAAVEMIHTATLVHDDVLDEADTRRHLPTVHQKWNTPTAVLLGDYLFSNAFYLTSETGSADACRLIGGATNLVCEGELQQLNAQEDFQLTQQQYLDIILGKTGRLISCSTRLGTMFHQPEVDESAIDSIERFGEKIGIAFQIHDDLLDLTGDSSTTGKTLGTDLQNQKATLPIIRALNQLADGQKLELVEKLSSPTAENQLEVVELLRSTGAIEYSQEIAREFASEAFHLLAELPEGPCKESLQALTQFVVSREF